MGLSVTSIALIPFHFASSNLGHINTNRIPPSPLLGGNRIEITQNPVTSCEQARAFAYNVKQRVARIESQEFPQSIARDNFLINQQNQAVGNLQSANTHLQNLTYQFRQVQEQTPQNYQRLNKLQSEINSAQWQVNIRFQEYVRSSTELQASRNSLLALGSLVAQLSQVAISYNARFGSSCGYVQKEKLPKTYLASQTTIPK